MNTIRLAGRAAGGQQAEETGLKRPERKTRGGREVAERYID